MGKIKRRLVVNILLGFVCVISVLFFYGTFSLNTDYVFKSDIYDISSDYIEDISVNTSIELFVKYFDIDNCSIKVVDKDNKELSEGFVTNGSKTVLYGDNGKVITSYINIIKGDYNNDGILNDKDFYEMGKCLVNNCSFDSYTLKSIDIDGDNEFHINDLVLLEKTINDGYQNVSIDNKKLVLQSGEVGRVVGGVKPEYGVNTNLKWESSETSIAVVDNAGRVTGKKEGEVIIKAITLDGKYSDEVLVVVDNTIQLSSYDGLGYVGGKDLVINIKAVDYDNLSCSVENENIASCKLDGKELVLSGNGVGETIIHVNSLKYGSVDYKFVVRSVYLNIIPNYVCLGPNSSHLVTLSGLNMGNLSFNFEDRDIVKDAYMTMYDNRKMLRIDAGSKQGRTIINVSEDNGNTTEELVVDVSSIRVSEMGIITHVGEEASLALIGDNLGEVTCSVDNENLGSCLVLDNKVIVKASSVGIFNVNLYNKMTYQGYVRECGQTMFVVVVQEE